MARAKAEPNVVAPNMMNLVREALNELGDVSPKAIQQFILEKHGVEMKTTMISSYKSNIAKKEGIAAGKLGESGAVSVKDISTIRNLLDRLGQSQLQTLVKVLSK